MVTDVSDGLKCHFVLGFDSEREHMFHFSSLHEFNEYIYSNIAFEIWYGNDENIEAFIWKYFL